MKIFRHPIRSIREPFGTAGLIVAVIALIAALGGSALAAKGALTPKQKKEVEKIAKKFAGKPGAAGAVGPQGPAGAKGDAGAAGAAGKDGNNGSPGTDGKSAEAVAFTGTKKVGSVECTEGGIEVKSASPATAVCNGTSGSGGGPLVLQSEQTETGSWWLVGDGSEYHPTALSFPIPLDSADAEQIQVEYWKEGKEAQAPDCPGNTLEPSAEPGTLCIYFNAAHQFGTSGLNPQVNRPNFTEEEEEKVGPSGAVLILNVPLKSPAENGGIPEQTGGSFALTAP